MWVSQLLCLVCAAASLGQVSLDKDIFYINRIYRVNCVSDMSTPSYLLESNSIY